MLRSRVQLRTLKPLRTPQPTRHKSTLQDLTKQSRIKPPGPNPPSTHKPGIAQFSRILQWTLVPVVFGYMALYSDFGEHEHIFSPLRRWVQGSKDGFWELSPEEKRMAQNMTSCDPADVYEGGAGSNSVLKGVS